MEHRQQKPQILVLKILHNLILTKCALSFPTHNHDTHSSTELWHLCQHWISSESRREVHRPRRTGKERPLRGCYKAARLAGTQTQVFSLQKLLSVTVQCCHCNSRCYRSWIECHKLAKDFWPFLFSFSFPELLSLLHLTGLLWRSSHH